MCRGALDRVLDLCARLATDRPVLVAVAFGLLLLASGVGLSRLTKETLGEGLTVEPAGLQYLLRDWLEELLAGQRRGLGFAFGAVALMMILGLASLRTGLWSMVPNTLPLVALGGLLGLCWDSVDSDVAGVAMIAIGIGVDDTIHYLMRLRVEWDRQETVADAIRAAMHYAGRGIVITTVILVLGFAPFALSDYVTLLFFGTLLPYCLVVALLADVLLVPAMVQLGWIRYRGGAGTSTAGGATPPPPCPSP